MTNIADSDLDLHCLQRQGISGFCRIRDNNFSLICYDLRDEMYTKAREYSEQFKNYLDTEKMCFILSNDCCMKVAAKTCSEILK